MKNFTTMLILFCILSCNKVISTDVETNAIQEILNFYGGECLKKKGVESLNGKTKRYFEVEISKSKLLDAKPQNSKSNSANIAYLFYSNLGSEKENFDEIKVKIILSNGSVEEFSYSTEELMEIQKIQVLLNIINEKIIKREYDELVSFFDVTVKIDSKSIETLYSNFESEYGAITKIQFQGLDFKETHNFGVVIATKQAIVFEKINILMTIVLNKNSNKIISIEFD